MMTSHDDVQMAPSTSTHAPEPASMTVPATSTTVEVSDFDWEAYISAYKGRTKIRRLLFLAERAPELRIPCADAALQLITTTTKDVSLYHHALAVRNTVARRAHAEEGGNGEEMLLPNEQRRAPQTEWSTAQEKANRVELEKLDLELRNYQNNLIKESIRMGYRDLGDHLRQTGALNEALKYYIKTREFCSTNEHLVEMCLNVIETSLELKEYSAVGGYVSKAEGLMDAYNPQAAEASAKAKASSIMTTSTGKGGTTSGADAIGALFRAGGSSAAANPPSVSAVEGQFQSAASLTGREAESSGKRHIRQIRSRLQVANGIANLGQGRFAQAARSFLEVDADLGDAFATMASRDDVATYVVLCGLAMMSRQELKAKVIDRAPLKATLEDNTLAQQLLDTFYACDYRRALQHLEQLGQRARLDLVLAPHFDTLAHHITQRALRQFVLPFDTLQVDRLAESLGWTGTRGIERVLDELALLIQRGDIDGRLDVRNNILTSSKAQPRQALFAQALRTGQRQIAASQTLLLRVSLIQNGLVAKASNERNEH